MSIKFKIVFYNLMIFMVIFDLIYLFVWILSIEMNPLKAAIVASISALLMPWARVAQIESGRKVVIRSYAYLLYGKFLKK
jgi:hypothetical protein